MNQTVKVKTKRGNWFEQQEMEEKRLREYLEKKKKGTLLTQIIDKKFAHHLHKVELSKTNEEKHIKFGSKIALFNENTKGFISVDLDTKLHHVLKKFGVTTINQGDTFRRNTFIIEKCTNKGHQANWDPMYISQGEENLLHYGEPFIIKCLPEFFNETLHLQSEKKKFGTQSPLTFNQQVTMCGKYNYECVWTVVYRDPKYRLEFEGELVEANHPVILFHCATGSYLCSDKAYVLNDFGKECETSCKSLKLHKEDSVFYIVLNKHEN